MNCAGSFSKDSIFSSHTTAASCLIPVPIRWKFLLARHILCTQEMAFSSGSWTRSLKKRERETKLHSERDDVSSPPSEKQFLVLGPPILSFLFLLLCELSPVEGKLFQSLLWQHHTAFSFREHKSSSPESSAPLSLYRKFGLLPSLQVACWWEAVYSKA